MTFTINCQPGSNITIVTGPNEIESQCSVEQFEQPEQEVPQVESIDIVGYENPSPSSVIAEQQEQMSDREYFAKDALSSHLLMDFIRCPMYCVDKREIRETEQFITGRAAHKLILEGESEFNESYVVDGPINPKTGKHYGRETKAFADWIAEKDPENKLEFLTAEQKSICYAMNSSVYNHDLACELFAEDSTLLVEAPIFGEMFGVDVKGRLDCYSSVGLIDLKTIDDLDRFKFHWRDYMYDVQLAFYHMLVTEVCKANYCQAYIIAVEKKHPYRCGVFYITPETMQKARAKTQTAIENYRESLATNSWPTLYEEMRSL